jgi:tight adherence protein C
MPLVILLTATALVAGGLAMFTLTVARPRPRAVGVHRSLELVEQTRMAPYVPVAERPARERLWRPLGRGLLHLGRRISPVGTPERLRRRLDLAGNAGGWDVETVFISKAVSVIVFGGTGVLLLLLRTTLLGLFVASLFAAIGYWLPDVILYNAGLKRQDALRKAAPDAIDMLTICVEAGLGFDAGLAQVAGNTRGPLAADFARLLQEMRIGRSRAEAFTEFAGRTTVPEIKAFASSLVQADRLGVPVASVLREQAAEMRVRRRQRAEERAQKVPVKIIFPVLFCIFPAFFVVIIGPGAIRIAEALIHV